MTPLCWAFPLGFAEARDSVPRDGNGRTIQSEVTAIEQEYLGRHARLVEHLLELGADPNIKTTGSDVAELPKKRKSVHVPGNAYGFPEGFAVTHLAAAGYYASGFSFLPIVLANGGDPNLVGRYGMTPAFFACGADEYLMNSGGASAQNVALLIEAGADVEVRNSYGGTLIGRAALVGRSKIVFLLLHAGVDFRAKDERGNWVLASSVRKRQGHLVGRSKRWLKEFPDADWVRLDPYHLEVAGFLEQQGMLPEGTCAKWKQEFDQLIEEYGKVAYSDRDPFVDEWVAKRKKAQDGAAARETTPLEAPE